MKTVSRLAMFAICLSAFAGGFARAEGQVTATVTTTPPKQVTVRANATYSPNNNTTVNADVTHTRGAPANNGTNANVRVDYSRGNLNAGAQAGVNNGQTTYGGGAAYTTSNSNVGVNVQTNGSGQTTYGGGAAYTTPNGSVGANVQTNGSGQPTYNATANYKW